MHVEQDRSDQADHRRAIEEDSHDAAAALDLVVDPLEKGSDLSVHTAEDLRQIAATLNSRPGPTLDLQTPAQRKHELLTPAA